MKKMAGYMRPYAGALGLAVIFIICDVIAEILQPMLMAKIVGQGIQAGDLRYILVVGGIMVGLALISIVAGTMNARFSARAGVGFAADLRKGLFDKVQSFSFKNIDDFSTASLSTRLTNDVTLMQNTAIMGMRILIRAPLMLVFAIIMALQMSRSLSGILAVATPVLLVSVAIIVCKAMPMFTVMQKSIDRVNSNVQENVTNVRVVKSFVREEFEKEKFGDSNDTLMRNSMRAMNLVILNMPVMMLIMNGCILAVLSIGGKQVINGTLDVASMSAFINYIMMILMSLMMISMLFVMLTRASASYKRIKEVLYTEVDLTDPAGGEKTDGAGRKIRGEVAFEHVFFRYNQEGEESEDVLEDISLTARPGEVVAIIGGTGAGKSSLIQLIPRLYDVSRGRVTVDGKDVREYDLEHLRENIGVVLQKNTLFSGTIAENLRWGNENATDEEVVQAAKAAQAHDFIESFPMGYNTWIEQGGVNVSGGQKQRLCIARAMLKKPAILILDDSTSAVDTATESRIRQAFDRELAHTTTFIIAQRISSVQEADKIVVMDDGKIAGIGTHQELLASNEEYREIYESQMGKEATA
nr:ABC transporter ATP-binding protein [Bacilliculturomica massiliensis]